MYSHLRYSTQIFLISRFKPWFFCRVFCGGFYFSFLFVFISGFFFGWGYLHMYSHFRYSTQIMHSFIYHVISFAKRVTCKCSFQWIYLYASFCLLDWQHVVRSSMLVVVLLQTKQVLISVDYSIYLYTHIFKIYLIL